MIFDAYTTIYGKASFEVDLLCQKCHFNLEATYDRLKRMIFVNSCEVCKENENSINYKSIDILNISSSLVNKLNRNDISIINHLLKSNYSHLREIVGQRNINKIIKELREYNLYLGHPLK